MKKPFLTKKNNNLKGATWRLSTAKKPSNILRSKKAYGLKISESIIYIKGYFYTFFSTVKYIEVQSNKVIILAKTLRSFNSKAFKSNVICSMLMSMSASLRFLWVLEGLSEGTRALGNLRQSDPLALWALGHIRHSDTRARRHLGIQALGYLIIRCTLFSRLIYHTV